MQSPARTRRPDRSKRRARLKESNVRPSELLRLPNSVLLEILSHVLPKDLLSLGRSCKQLKTLLMANAAQQVWRSARSNVSNHIAAGFPECPPDLSEPQYASLIFDTLCRNCYKAPARHVNLAYRMKACNKCHWYAIGVFMHGGAWTFENHLNCFSTFGLTAVGIKDIKRAYRFLLTRSLPSERDYLQAVFDIISKSSEGRFFVPEFERVAAELARAEKRLGGEAFRAYVSKCRAASGDITKHGVALAAWYERSRLDARRQRQQEQEQELSIPRVDEQMIFKKLRELGWGSCDFPKKGGHHFRTWYNLLHQVIPLEDWDKAWLDMKPKLEFVLAQTKASNIRARPATPPSWGWPEWDTEDPTTGIPWHLPLDGFEMPQWGENPTTGIPWHLPSDGYELPQWGD